MTICCFELWSSALPDSASGLAATRFHMDNLVCLLRFFRYDTMLSINSLPRTDPGQQPIRAPGFALISRRHITFPMIPTLLAVPIALWIVWKLLRLLFSSTTLDNIPGPRSQSWLSGSFHHLTSTTGWEWHKNIAETYGGVVRMKGLVGSDILYVHDPKALHHILVKDQHIYEEQDLFIEGNKMILGEGIFTSLGERHRLQRKMLNPVFSISHMREMVNIFYEIGHKLENTFVTKAKNGPQEIDLLGWMTRLALELIGQSGLGYTFDSLADGTEPHPYGIASKQLTPAATSPWATMVQVLVIPKIARIGTPRFRRWLVDTLPIEPLHKIRDIVDILHNTSVEIYESKKKALEGGDTVLSEQIGKGNDIISILIKENMKAIEEERLSEVELLGQITSLTFAATDTTSGALARTLYQLALFPDVQAKVREEIRQARSANHGDDISYDTLVALPLLDAICRETLRLYPPVAMLTRVTRQDAVLPLTTPIKGINGEYIQEISVPKDTEINISILASNRNPEFWGPDSYEWKPERWLNPLPEAVINAKIPGVYSHLLTFIGGGRSCIGFKFSQLEMKVILALLLESIEFSISDKKIVWLMTGITTPNVEGSKSHMPTLPIVISLAK